MPCQAPQSKSRTLLNPQRRKEEERKKEGEQDLRSGIRVFVSKIILHAPKTETKRMSDGETNIIHLRRKLEGGSDTLNHLSIPYNKR
jgi:hypothetical protein